MNAYVSMQACAQHVEYQLPNKHSHDGFLLDSIQSLGHTDTGVGGKHADFEATVAHLLPYDPVAKKHAASTKQPNSLMSDVEGSAADTFYQKFRLCSCGTKLQHSRNHWYL